MEQWQRHNNRRPWRRRKQQPCAGALYLSTDGQVKPTGVCSCDESQERSVLGRPRKWRSNGSNTCMWNCGHHKHKWLICSPYQKRGCTELGCVQALWAPPFEDTPQCGTDSGHGWCFCCLAQRGHRNNMGQPKFGREHQARAERGIRNTVAHSQLNNVYCRKGRPCGSILGIPHRNPHTMLRSSRRAKMSRRWCEPVPEKRVGTESKRGLEWRGGQPCGGMPAASKLK